MAITKDTEEKIQQLQMFEQSLQSFMMQKQSLQMQLLEAESALGELGNAEKAYKIIGNIMISADKEELQKGLESKKETAELRIRTIEKQEKTIRDRAAAIQKEVLGAIKEE